MRKGIALFVTTLLLSLLLMTGCGGAQGEYDAVVADRDAAKAQVSSLQAEVTSLQTELNELQASLNETQMALDTANANYEDLKSDVTSTWAALDTKIEAAGMIFSYYSYANKYSVGLISDSEFEDTSSRFLANFGGVINPVGNAELFQMWEDAVLAAGQGDSNEFMTKFAAVMDLLTELVEEDVAAMDVKLR